MNDRYAVLDAIKEGENQAKASQRAKRAGERAVGRSFTSRKSSSPVKFSSMHGHKQYAVIRIQKIKSRGALTCLDRHNRRDPEHITKNVDQSRMHLNTRVIGHPIESIEASVMARLDGLKLRKNGVLATEMILSASAEYFNQGDASERAARLDSWVSENRAWLVEQFGEMVVSADLHLDETTPHLHVVIAHIPSGEYSFNQVFGGSRDALRRLQNGYAQSMVALGIDRGIPKNTKADHSGLSQFYSAVNSKIEGLPKIVPKPSVLRPEGGGFFSTKPNPKQAKWDVQMEAHKKSVLEYRNFCARELPKLHKKAIAAEQMSKRAETEIAESQKMKQEYSGFKEKAESLRELPLDQVLIELGATESLTSHVGHKSREFILPDGTKIGMTGQLWVEQASGTGGQGAIDLVMRLDGVGFKGAVQRLASGFPTDDLVRQVAAVRAAGATQEVEAIMLEPPTLPERDRSKDSAIVEYLCERGISSDWAQRFVADGIIFGDARSNAVFRRVGGGAFIRGMHGGAKNTYKRTLGGKLFGALELAGDKSKVVICEGPIDALALKTMYPDSYVVAVGGNLIDPSDPILERVLGEAKEIMGSFDNDSKGKELLDKLTAKYGKKVRPNLPPDINMDWSQKLKNNPQFSKLEPSGKFRNTSSPYQVDTNELTMKG